MKINKPFTQILFLLAILYTSTDSFSQCSNWINHEDKETLQNEYVIYRDFLRRGDQENAFDHWKILYENVPAADGKTTTIYTDGIKLYIDKFQKEQNKNERKRIAETIQQLMEEQKKCYPGSELVPIPEEIREFRSEVSPIHDTGD